MYVPEGCNISEYGLSSTIISNETVKNEEGDLIPKLIHFVLVSMNGKPKKIPLCYFVSIKAAKIMYPDWQIWVHHDGNMVGEHWNNSLQYIDKLITVTVPASIQGQWIKFVQHKADWIRLDIMRKYGGIYLDIDVIAIRPIPTALRTSNVVLAREKNEDRICNAIIMSKPNSKFINEWIKNYISDYKSRSWSYNSMEYPTLLSKLYTGEVNVQERNLFFYGYEEIYTKNLNIDHHLFLHYWHSNAKKNWKSTEGLDFWTLNDLYKQDSTFSNIMLRYLNWKEERDGPKYRRQWSIDEIIEAERRNPW